MKLESLLDYLDISIRFLPGLVCEAKVLNVVDHHFQRVPRVKNGELESPADLPSAGLPLVAASLWISKLGNVQVCLLLLLVSQARVEECVDQVGVGDLIGEPEDAGEEACDVLLSPLGNLSNLASTDGQTFWEAVELAEGVEGAELRVELVELLVRPEDVAWVLHVGPLNFQDEHIVFLLVVPLLNSVNLNCCYPALFLL